MKKVMILGAGPLQSYVIKRAKEMGYYTICVDMAKSAVGYKYAHEYRVINIVDEKKCLKYAKQCNINGVLTAATDYGVLTASYISEQMNLNGIKYNVAQTVKNKFKTRKKLSLGNINEVTQFFEVSNEKEIEMIVDTIKYPVMVKPCDGSGSKGVRKVEKQSELFSACYNAMDFSLINKAMIETFVVGDEFGVESFVCDNEIYVLGIMKKIMTKPPSYAELGHCIPSGLCSEIEEKIRKTVKNAIKALDINFGAVNMDLIVTPENKVCIVDVGARMGGNLIGSHIIPYATGIDYVGNIVRAAVGDKSDFIQKHSTCIATSILALTPGKIKKLPELNHDIYEEGIIDIVLNIKKGDLIREYCNNLDGCGYVVSRGQTANEAIERAFNTKKCLDLLLERE